MKVSPKRLRKGLSWLGCMGLVAIIGLSGCEKANITFGQNQIDNNLTNIIKVDTITPVMSTLFTDSIPTSGSGVALVGNYNDAYYGPITARSYFEIAPPSYQTIDPRAIFDSLVLYVVPNKTYYGDSTAPIDLYASQIQYQMVFGNNSSGAQNSSFFNIDSFPVHSTAIGHVSVNIKPYLPDTVYIPLDPTLGSQFFDDYRNQKYYMQNANQFLQEFAGIQLSSGNNNPNAKNIYGFKDSILVKLWYHLQDIHSSSEALSFRYSAKNYQFNEYRSVPKAPLDEFNHSFSTVVQQIYSTKASFNHMAYVNPLLGYTTKIQFPGLRGLYSADTNFSRILKAQIIFRPLYNSYNYYTLLPAQLQLAASTSVNLPGATVASGVLTLDYATGNTFYTFDISSYLASEILNPAANFDGDGLILEPSAANYFTQPYRLVLGDRLYQSPLSSDTYFQTQVILYYVSVKSVVQ